MTAAPTPVQIDKQVESRFPNTGSVSFGTGARPPLHNTVSRTCAMASADFGLPSQTMRPRQASQVGPSSAQSSFGESVNKVRAAPSLSRPGTVALILGCACASRPRVASPSTPPNASRTEPGSSLWGVRDRQRPSKLSTLALIFGVPPNPDPNPYSEH